MTVPVVFPPSGPAGPGPGRTGVQLPATPGVPQQSNAPPLFGGWFWAAIIILVLALVYAPRYGYAVAGLIILYLGLSYYEPGLRQP